MYDKDAIKTIGIQKRKNKESMTEDGRHSILPGSSEIFLLWGEIKKLPTCGHCGKITGLLAEIDRNQKI